jgi:hypothetical protein
MGTKYLVKIRLEGGRLVVDGLPIADGQAGNVHAALTEAYPLYTAGELPYMATYDQIVDQIKKCLDPSTSADVQFSDDAKFGRLAFKRVHVIADQRR